MKIILPSFEILTPISDGGVLELQRIERAARTCYKSEDKITEDGKSARKMVKMLRDKGHEAMLEHSDLSVKFITDRGVSHELVRHRLASFAQESTRWCDYNGDKFDGQLTFVLPYEFDIPDVNAWFNDEKMQGKLPKGFILWFHAMKRAEEMYRKMRNEGCTPQLARSVLPNSLKTEIVVTANYREWRNILKLRTAPNAHSDMKNLTNELLKKLQKRIPVVFDDIPIQHDI